MLSGMQPTGGLHVGNYLGALRNWVEIIESGTYDSLCCIVDAHAITVDYDPRELSARTLDAAMSYIAGGVNPEHATIFVQSAVPEHTELAWYLSSVTSMGDLNRMTQFKEKSEQQNLASAGLFTYPILMAADILVYKATAVPVGDDQVQHLELAREIARRFNRKFGETFPEPKPLLSKTPRIMGVDGKSKMSKSRGNTIDLLDTPKALEKKVKRAFTDPKKLQLGDPGRPEICNVFTLHNGFSTPEEVAQIDGDCRSGKLGCGACKQLLVKNMNGALDPIREKYADLKAHPDKVTEILHDGAAKARALAGETMREVRSGMGLNTGR
jgi:tryptophanyl-tRNA synthetase